MTAAVDVSTLSRYGLRPYQEDAVSAVLAEWGADTRRTAVVLPTGTGKSRVIAALAAESSRLGLRVAMLAHRAELLDQMAKEVSAVAPTPLSPTGIVRSDRDDSDHDIVAASFQTIVNDNRLRRIGRRDVLLVDEVHHVPSASYRRVVESFGPETFFCGFTATLRRGDGRALREMIDSVAYEKSLRWAVDNDYLVKPRGLTVKIPELDLADVKSTAGDFQANELAEVMEAETPEIVKAILRHARDRRVIVFAASVRAADDIAQSLTGQGMPSEAVTGRMPYNERRPVYDRFRSGATQALITVVVLTEGADFPMCDAVVIARPTQSQNLFCQMVGRSLRLYPGKTDALVLDLVGTSRVLKLVTVTDLDAGVDSTTVDTDGEEIETEEDAEAFEPATESVPNRKRLGPIDTVGIDLLGPDETRVLWLTTVKGVPFTAPANCDHFWFLWESGSDRHGPLYRVGMMTVKGEKSGGWLAEGRSLPLNIAVATVEDDVRDRGYSLPLNNGPFRRSRPPSDAQLIFARSLGIVDCESMTRARLSDEMTVVLISRRLDAAR